MPWDAAGDTYKNNFVYALVVHKLLIRVTEDLVNSIEYPRKKRPLCVKDMVWVTQLICQNVFFPGYVLRHESYQMNLWSNHDFLCHVAHLRDSVYFSEEVHHHFWPGQRVRHDGRCGWNKHPINLRFQDWLGKLKGEAYDFACFADLVHHISKLSMFLWRIFFGEVLNAGRPNSSSSYMVRSLFNLRRRDSRSKTVKAWSVIQSVCHAI